MIARNENRPLLLANARVIDPSRDMDQRGDVLIVMLGGGDKSTQQQDIDAAQTLAKDIED